MLWHNVFNKKKEISTTLLKNCDCGRVSSMAFISKGVCSLYRRFQVNRESFKPGTWSIQSSD